ncbi:MAG: PKD domain-containing protein [Owenweeksia sp.]|nr:PKD domain-containing protein [Owenweeksia sp.]
MQVQFTDQSQNASSVFWDFGDSTTSSDTSNLLNPVYTYPGPGTYQVRCYTIA